VTPRNRKTHRHLPPRVYQRKSGSFEYHPPDGGSITIAKKGASMAEVFKAYEEAVVSNRNTSLKYLAERYHSSEQFKRLALVTQKDYLQASEKPLLAFKDTVCPNLRAQHIRQYMDKRGQSSRFRANREMAWLSNVFNYAFERGLMPINPCTGVKPFPEESRKKYVSDDAYNAMLNASPLVLQVAMEIAYCTGIRPTDALNLKWGNVQADGIHITTSKTKSDIIKEYTPRLKAALEAAKGIPGGLNFYVIHTESGSRYTPSGFHSAWRRAMSNLPKEDRFQFRDLRSKGVTDFKGDKKKFSTHKTDAMVGRYTRKPTRSPSIGDD